MEKDTKEQAPSDNPIPSEEFNDYQDDYDDNDEYIIGYALGNIKDDPASKRSRPRRTPLGKLQITDEDTIPKMPSKLLPKPNENQYNSKIKDLEFKINSKKKSIDALKKEKQKIIDNLKGISGQSQKEKNEVKDKVKELRDKLKKKEEETKEIRQKLKDATDELKNYEKLGCGTSEKKISQEIKSIQESLSYGDLSVVEERRLNDRKSDLEAYLKVVRKCKPIRDECKAPLDELNKLRNELKEAQKAKNQVYDKLGIPKNKEEYLAQKSKEEGKERKENPEVNNIKLQIESLSKERKELLDEKYKLMDEYNQQWYDYEEEQKLIDYIKKAKDKIKRLKDVAAREKKREKKKLKENEKEKEKENPETEQIQTVEKPKKRVNDEKLRQVEHLEKYFSMYQNVKPEETGAPAEQEPSATVEEEKEKTKLDQDLEKGKLKKFERDENFGFELGITGAGKKKKKGKKPKRSARTQEDYYITLDFNVIKEISDLGLTPPGNVEDLPKFFEQLDAKKNNLIENNVEVQEDVAKTEEKVEDVAEAKE